MKLPRTRVALYSATLIVLAACSTDNPVAPAAPRISAALLANGEISQALFSAAPANSPVDTIIIRHGQTLTYSFGDHAVRVPAGAVCDPATSGYGPQVWMQSCNPIGRDFTVVVKHWTNSQGYPLVEFSPDIRFAPSKPAMIYLHEPAVSGSSSSAILYCPTGSAICVNESSTDPALSTWKDPVTGWLWRIVRHFSGYNVWA